MGKLVELWQRLIYYLRRDEFDRELEEEMRFHLEMKAEENLREGMSAEEARYAAARGFGNETLLREVSKEMWGFRTVEMLAQDVHYGARMIFKNPGFTLVAVLSLALGIGANTAIFSVINAVILRPLPFAEPEQLVKVYQTQPDPTKGMLPSIWGYPQFEILRDESQSFASVEAVTQNAYNLTGTDEPERLQVEMVSSSYFPLLGINAIKGRTFTADEDANRSGQMSALLSYSLWQRRFGSDVNAIGKTIELDKHEFIVVGVLPPGFRGQDGTAQAWVTMMAAPVLRFKKSLTNANNYWFQVIARLKKNVSLAQAQSEMQLISQRIEQKYPGPSQGAKNRIVTIAPLQSAKVDPAIKKSFLILLAAVGFVLLIACVNIANLLLARAVARHREFALRAALGAGRWRLVRQLLTESLLLALLSGALGVLIAFWGLHLLKNFRPSDNAQFWSAYTRTFDFFSIDLDWRVLSFNFALALLTGVLFGLLPAIQSSFVDVNEALKEGSGSSAKALGNLRRLNVRCLLVVGEVALSLVLLISAGLMIKSLARLQSVNLGFSPENVLTMVAPSRDAKPEFYEQLLERVQALPGVESAALGSTAPLFGYSSKSVMGVEGRAADDETGVGVHSVSPDYFKTLGIKLLRGRVFTSGDRAGAPRVALINEAAAEEVFKGEDPIGKRINVHLEPTYQTDEKLVEIIGIVGNARYRKLEEAIEPDVYLSSLQPTDPAPTLIVRTGVDPATVAASVRREVLSLDKNVPLINVQTMTERALEVTSRTRFIAVMLGLFAGLALLLSVIGIYGVMAYNVSARTREIGIRMALGARASDVVKLVILEALLLVFAGAVLGLCTALATTRFISSLLFGLTPADPATILLSTLLLISVAALAGYLPAKRASRVDPMLALRCE